MKPAACHGPGMTILACCNPEFIGIFKLTGQGLENASVSLWMAFLVILKPL